MRINDLPTNLKPREKLKHQGVQTLSDIELLCLIIGSGTKRNDVHKLSTQILRLFTKKPHVTLRDLQQIDGIGLATGTKLLAVYELQKRMFQWHQQTYPLTTAKDVYQQYKHLFVNTSREELHAIFLNTQLEPIGEEMIFRGTLDSITLHAREIFHSAIAHCAHSVIIIHNHPSQNPQPSEADLLFTKQIMQIGDLVGIPVLDHMIFTNKTYWSYAQTQQIG